MNCIALLFTFSKLDDIQVIVGGERLRVWYWEECVVTMGGHDGGWNQNGRVHNACDGTCIDEIGWLLLLFFQDFAEERKAEHEKFFRSSIVKQGSVWGSYEAGGYCSWLLEWVVKLSTIRGQWAARNALTSLVCMGFKPQVEHLAWLAGEEEEDGNACLWGNERRPL